MYGQDIPPMNQLIEIAVQQRAPEGARKTYTLGILRKFRRKERGVIILH